MSNGPGIGPGIGGGDRGTGVLELPGEALALMAEAVLALRTTGDLGVSWGIASANVRRALGACDARLLRVDPRSGALYCFEESGVETPYLAEHGGPVEWVMRHDRALFDEGSGGPRAPRETLLWQPPRSRACHSSPEAPIWASCSSRSTGRAATPRRSVCSCKPSQTRSHLRLNAPIFAERSRTSACVLQSPNASSRSLRKRLRA